MISSSLHRILEEFFPQRLNIPIMKLGMFNRCGKNSSKMRWRDEEIIDRIENFVLKHVYVSRQSPHVCGARNMFLLRTRAAIDGEFPGYVSSTKDFYHSNASWYDASCREVAHLMHPEDPS